MNTKIKVLFICKKKKSSGPGPYTQVISSGLLNSATFVNNMLVANGIESKIVEVQDNNDIDREVHSYKPTHVIIEALWVVPSKFEVLTKLHPDVKWIIRLHSEVPFLANEGIAMEWIFGYMKYPSIIVSVNSRRIEKELNTVLPKPVLYLPNFYPVDFKIKFNWTASEQGNVINIGCFGAVRPMKNHLLQAMVAIDFANSIGRKLNFHINATRIENNGDPVLKNIRNLFANQTEHILVEHAWLSHDDFVKLIASMDVLMQVSMSETFNIVTADAVNSNVPVIVSDEIKWVSSLYKVEPTNAIMMKKKLRLAWWTKWFNLQWINKAFLWINSISAKNIWVDYFDNEMICNEMDCGYCEGDNCKC